MSAFRARRRMGANSLKGGFIRDYLGDHFRVMKGETGSLDSGSQ